MGLDGEGSREDLKSMVRIYGSKNYFSNKNKKNCYNPTERKEGYEQSVLISTSQMINFMKICSASLLEKKC